MQPQNTLVTEIGLIAVSVAIVAGAVALRILGYIDNALLLEMIGVVGALWGLNGALKAPSPAQQNQLQQLVQYALSVLQPQATVAPPQPQQAAPLVMPSTSDPAMAPTVNPAPGTALHTLINPAGTGTVTTPPTQFKSITIPDVSLPMAAVGQGIPLGQ